MVEVFEIGEDGTDSSFAYGPLLKRLIVEGGTGSRGMKETWCPIP
jgi:hypothetical protein